VSADLTSVRKINCFIYISLHSEEFRSDLQPEYSWPLLAEPPGDVFEGPTYIQANTKSKIKSLETWKVKERVAWDKPVSRFIRSDSFSLWLSNVWVCLTQFQVLIKVFLPVSLLCSMLHKLHTWTVTSTFNSIFVFLSNFCGFTLIIRQIIMSFLCVFILKFYSITQTFILFWNFHQTEVKASCLQLV